MRHKNNHPEAEILSECDKEPIHLSGSIQPVGALIVFDWNNLLITHTSKNIHQFFPVQYSDLVGKKISQEVALRPLWNVLSGIHNTNKGQQLNQRIFGESENWPGGDREDNTTSIHLIVRDNTAIVEIEADKASLIDLTTLFKIFTDMTTDARASDSIGQCAQIIADTIRSVVNYDRVMVYKFDEDYNGTVIGESVADHLTERFLAQKFPASDIPRQARALYLEKLVRVIADIDHKTIDIYPQCDVSTNSAIDLTQSDLRSVSPAHIAYLNNMGVRATLTMSLIDGDRLWGMIACHHYAPRRLGPKSRQACKLIAMVSGNALIEFEHHEEAKWRISSWQRIDELRVSLRTVSAPNDVFEEIWRSIRNTIDCDGLCLLFADHMWSVNSSLKKTEVIAIKNLVNEIEEERVFSTHNGKDPKLLSIQGALARDQWCGLAVIPIDGSGALVALRYRKPYNDIWAGRPEKPVLDRGGLNLLQPRKSFEAWVDVTANLSTPWPDRELIFLEQIALMAAERISALYRRESLDAQRRLSRIVDQSNDSVILTDQLGYITWVDLSP